MSYDIFRIKSDVAKILTAAKCYEAANTIPIKLNGKLTRTLGRVLFTEQGDYCTPTAIEFSAQMIDTCDDDTIYSVIQHEVAHLIVIIRTHQNHGHDALFKSVCWEIGCSNDGYKTKVNRTVADSQIYKYELFCPACNKIVGKYHRAGKVVKNFEAYRCCKCGGEIQLIQNF